MNRKIILASASQRRKDLLKKYNYNFSIVPSGVEEISDGVYYKYVPIYNAELKANDISNKYPNDIVIGADTVVELGNKTLGKPNDIEDAIQMVKSLSGKTHSVVTSVCVIIKSISYKIIFSEISDVTFKELTTNDIKAYFKLINPLDKAGAYAAQEYRDMIIDSIDGDIENVIGLPCSKLNIILINLLK